MQLCMQCDVDMKKKKKKKNILESANLALIIELVVQGALDGGIHHAGSRGQDSFGAWLLGHAVVGR